MKQQKGTVVFLYTFLAIFILYGLTLILPVIWLLMNALKTSRDYLLNSSFSLPTGKLQWINFVNAFVEIKYDETSFFGMFFNSVWMSLLNIFVNIGCSTLTAYAMARYRFPGKTFLYSLAIIVQVVPIIGTGGAAYKFMATMGMVNNPMLIWLSWAGGFDFSFVVLYGYFQSISGQYAEAAEIDGASQFRVMCQVMIPQALPAIASLMILNFITAWNNYQTPMLYMPKFPTLALGIFSFEKISPFLKNGIPVYFCSVILSMIPVLIIFSCTQKMIMTNVTAGGLKG
jgi:ABC-type glycerol-3-phosphate transport system permease component